MTTAMTTKSVIAEMAMVYGMERAAFEATIKKTIMPAGVEPTNEELVAFLIAAREYNLNPFLKEIYAFPKKGGGVQAIVPIDGWTTIVNRNADFDGAEFEDSFDASGNLISITCKMYRRGRSYAVSVTEYMSECRRDTETWRKWPSRMLRHKAFIQCARYAFGFSGIVDPDEAERMEEVGVIDISAKAKGATLETARTLAKALAAPESVVAGTAEIESHTEPTNDPK
jgi:phage recombination protein Bet